HLTLLAPVADMGIQKDAAHRVVEKANALNKLLYGAHLLQERTLRTVDLVHSFGERLSAVVLEAHLRQQGVSANAWMSDDAGLMVRGKHGFALADLTATAECFQKTVLPDLTENTVVLTGYFGRTREDAVMTLGRGGSDYSAGVAAFALDAQKLVVWKDVDGFMTADPRVVPQARRISRLTYKEAEELGAFGAKILHPKTMAPLSAKKIPAEIRNVAFPQNVATLINGQEVADGAVAKSVAMKPNASLLTIRGGSLLNVSSVAYPLFDRLQEKDVPIDAISTSQSDLSLCFEEKYLVPIRAALKECNGTYADVTAETEAALLGLVGEGMRRHVGTSQRFFSALAGAGVNVRMISQGASETNITVAVSREDADKALKAVHAEFLE
ncbi:MAG: aspartate kinase, partial [Candidatus Micrarchaeota archaeon]|nr:aspartate kinase [Candidatus Micrarchaeota archaeon]